MKQVHAFTDGACSGNPGPGGWGAILQFGDHERELHGGATDTTNNRMELTAAIEAAGEDGYTLTTVNGAELTAMMDGDNVVLRDAAGNTATVTMTDIDASNGVVHVIDTVLMPQ